MHRDKVRESIRHAVLPFVGKAYGAWLVLALGVAFSVGAWHYATTMVDHEVHSLFEKRADLARNLLEQNLRRTEEVLYGARGLFGHADYTSRAEFGQFIRDIDVFQRIPHFQAIGFVRFLPAAGKKAFEATVRQNSSIAPQHANFAIHPKGERGDYFVVDYLEAVAGNENLAGFDMGSDPDRRQALERARDSGRLTVTTPTAVEPGKTERERLLFVMPIYRTGTVPATLAERQTTFAGAAIAEYWLDELMHDLLPGTLFAEIDVEIFRESIDGGEKYKSKDIIWDDDKIPHAFPTGTAAVAAFTAERSLELGGDRWWLRFFPLPQFTRGTAQAAPAILLVSGILLSLTLFVIILLEQWRRRRAEDSATRLAGDLQRREEQLDAIVNSLDDVIWSFAVPERRLSFVSESVARIFGVPAQRFYDDPKYWLRSIYPEDRARVASETKRALSSDKSLELEYRAVAADGGIHWLRMRFSVVRAGDGTPLRIDGIASDISARKRADDELLRLNRTLRMLSRCNEILVRASGEEALLSGICQTVVEVGGYQLAWVGYAEHDAAKIVRPVAQAGANGDYLAQAVISWGDNEYGGGPTGRAIRSGELVVCHDVDNDPGLAPWRQAASNSGFAATIALPLKGARGILGALNLYAPAVDAFDPAEVALLTELADDLAYGLVSLRREEERRRFEEQLEFRDKYDPLTNLANRSLLTHRLRQMIGSAKRSGQTAAVLHFDLDRFKAINDSLSFDIGDAVLKEMAARLGSILRVEDTVARIGGDEFVVILAEIAEAEDAARVARKLLSAVAQVLTVADREIVVTASVGISFYPRDSEDVDVLLKNADSAMAHAKADGRNTFRFFAPEMNARAINRLELEADLRRALERDELLLHYQPKVGMNAGEINGSEALLRWQHPIRGLISPAEFVPLAEETGLIVPVTDWVLAHVCSQLKAWLALGLPALPVAVNLSPLHFRSEDPAASVARALAASGIEARLLELELTEGMVVKDPEAAVATMHRLKALGVRLAIDDFGTGYSSLSYLKRFPIDALKIDRSFVTDITTDPEDAAITRAVIALAHSLNLKVIAEGVETEGQLNYLRQHRCDMMQGYYFSRPVPQEQFAALLAAGRRLEFSAETARTGRTLLIVDDEPSVISALKRQLRSEGYHIVTANSAREGFEVLARQPVQVILSDQRMPEMNGTEFLARVKSLYPDTIRIILSGYSELSAVTDAINRGAIFKFLNKPWEDEILHQEIREAFLHHESKQDAVA